MAFTPIETQEQFDEAIKERVARAKDSVRKEFDGFISPTELDAKTNELQKQLSGTTETVKTLTDEKTALEKQIEEATAKIAKYENDSVKTKIATEMGLSIKAIPFLQGNNEEEIRESAQSFKDLVGKPTPPMPTPEPPAGDSDEEAMKQMLRDMKGE